MRKFIFSALLLLSACAPSSDNEFNGYVEGEYVYISPYTSGILDEIFVSKGQKIDIGDDLFAIDNEIWSANLVQAQNELDKAYANLANLSKGKRKQELEVIIKQKAQADALLENAEKEYKRAKNLVKTNIVSKSDYDKKTADYQSAKEKVAELEASLESAKLSAREDELKAAQNDIEIAKQNLIKIKKQAENNLVKSKVRGQVEDVYFRLGEFVPNGNPVVAILPPENVKIRFFVPQKILPKIKLNMPLSINCDGCRMPLEAKVSFISTQSEFTPPVIYSVESREKLVYMLEAVFADKKQNLHPGQPITIRIDRHDQMGH